MADVENETERVQPHQGVLLSQNHVFGGKDGTGKVTKVCVIHDGNEKEVTSLCVNDVNDVDQSKTYQMLDGRGTSTRVCFVGSQHETPLHGFPHAQWENAEAYREGVDRGCMQTVPIEGDVPSHPQQSGMARPQAPCNGYIGRNEGAVSKTEVLPNGQGSKPQFGHGTLTPLKGRLSQQSTLGNGGREGGHVSSSSGTQVRGVAGAATSSMADTTSRMPAVYDSPRRRGSDHSMLHQSQMMQPLSSNSLPHPSGQTPDVVMEIDESSDCPEGCASSPNASSTQQGRSEDNPPPPPPSPVCGTPPPQQTLPPVQQGCVASQTQPVPPPHAGNAHPNEYRSMPAWIAGNNAVDAQSQIQTGFQPGIQPRMQPNMQTGTQPGIQGGMQTGAQPGIQGGMQTGAQPGIQRGMQTGAQPGIQGGMQMGAQPGMQAGAQPGMQAGAQPGMQTGAQPGMQTGAQPGMQAGAQPGIQGGMQTGAQPGVQAGAQPGIQPGMQTGAQPGIQGGMQTGAQPGMQAGAQPGIQPGMQLGVQPGMQMGVPPVVQPGVQPVVQPVMQPGMQMGVHPGVQQGMHPVVHPQLGGQTVGQRSIPGWFIPAPNQNVGTSGIPNSSVFQSRPPHQSSPSQSLVQNAVHGPVVQHLHRPAMASGGAQAQMGNGYQWPRLQRPMGNPSLAVQGPHPHMAQLQPQGNIHMSPQRMVVDAGRPMMSPGGYRGGFPSQAGRPHPHAPQGAVNMHRSPGAASPANVVPHPMTQPTQRPIQTPTVYPAAPQGGVVVGRPMPGVVPTPSQPVRCPYHPPPPRQPLQHSGRRPNTPVHSHHMVGPQPSRPAGHPHPSYAPISTTQVCSGSTVGTPSSMHQNCARLPHSQVGTPIMAAPMNAPPHAPQCFPRHHRPTEAGAEMATPLAPSPHPCMQSIGSVSASQPQGFRSGVHVAAPASFKVPPPPPPPSQAGPKTPASPNIQPSKTEIIRHPSARYPKVMSPGASAVEPDADRSPRRQPEPVSTAQPAQAKPFSRDPRLSQHSSAAGMDTNTDRGTGTPSVVESFVATAPQGVTSSSTSRETEVPEVVGARSKDGSGARNATVAGNPIGETTGQECGNPSSLHRTDQASQMTPIEIDCEDNGHPEKEEVDLEASLAGGSTPLSHMEPAPNLVDATIHHESMIMERDSDGEVTPEPPPAGAAEQVRGKQETTDAGGVLIEDVPGVGSPEGQAMGGKDLMTMTTMSPGNAMEVDQEEEEPAAAPEPDQEPTTPRGRSCENDGSVESICSPSHRSDVPSPDTPCVGRGPDVKLHPLERRESVSQGSLVPPSPSGMSPVEKAGSPADHPISSAMAERQPSDWDGGMDSAPPSPGPNATEKKLGERQIGKACSLDDAPRSPFLLGVEADANDGASDVIGYESDIPDPLEGTITVDVLRGADEVDIPRMETRMCIIGRPTANRPRARCQKLTSVDLRQDGTMICSVDLNVGATFICCLEDDDQPMPKKNVGEVLLSAGEMVAVPVVVELQEEVTKNENEHVVNGAGSNAFEGLVNVQVTWDGPDLAGGLPGPTLGRSDALDPPSDTMPVHAVETPFPAGEATGQQRFETASLTSGFAREPLPDENGKPRSTIIDCESSPECSEPWPAGDSNANGVLPLPEMDLDGGDDEQRGSQASNEQGIDEVDELARTVPLGGNSEGTKSLGLEHSPKPLIAHETIHRVPKLTGNKRDSPDNACGGLVRIPVEEGTLADVVPKRPKTVNKAMHNYDSTFVCSVRQSEDQQLDSVVLSTPDLQGAGPTVGSMVGFTYADSATLCWVGTERRAENESSDMGNLLGMGDLCPIPVVQDVGSGD